MIPRQVPLGWQLLAFLSWYLRPLVYSECLHAKGTRVRSAALLISMCSSRSCRPVRNWLSRWRSYLTLRDAYPGRRNGWLPARFCRRRKKRITHAQLRSSMKQRRGTQIKNKQDPLSSFFSDSVGPPKKGGKSTTLKSSDYEYIGWFIIILSPKNTSRFTWNPTAHKFSAVGEPDTSPQIKSMLGNLR